MLPPFISTLLLPNTIAPLPSPAPNRPPCIEPFQLMLLIVPPMFVALPCTVIDVLPKTRPFSPPPNTVRMVPELMVMVVAVLLLANSISLISAFDFVGSVRFAVPTAPLRPPPYTSPPITIWDCADMLKKSSTPVRKNLPGLALNIWL